VPWCGRGSGRGYSGMHATSGDVGGRHVVLIVLHRRRCMRGGWVRPVLADVLDEGHMTRCVDTPGSDVVAAIAPMIGRIPRNTHATDRAESLCGVVEEMLG
jgi:hypothetical protein